MKFQQRRERKTFSEDFKCQMVEFYLHRKKLNELVAEYDLTPSALNS